MTSYRFLNIRSLMWWLGISLWLLGIFASQPVSAQEKKTFVAFSMKVAQERVEEAVRKGQDFRTEQPDLFYLGGITKPWAVVIDSASGDWILLGERDPKASVLTLDDWVVALKVRFMYPGEDPGVTIAPIPSDTCRKEEKKEACRDATRQEVRFFAGIENTHFGQVCYEADWLMKRIAFALEQVPVQGLETYYALAVKQVRQAGNAKTSVSSRFWFYPIVNRVNVVGDVVLLEKMQMGVFTEVLDAKVNGQSVKDVDTFGHYPSEGFSRSFSENYDALAQAREVLETLRGLTRLAALAKGLTQVDARLPLAYYLRDYQAKQLLTPREVEVLRRREPEAGFEITGGARLMALVTRLQGGDTSALQELVVGARPASQALSWTFELEIREGQITGVRLPSESGDLNQIGPLFAQAQFLQEKKYTEATIGAYTKVLQLNPQLAEGYNNRGVAYYEQKGHDEQALADFTKALELNPYFVQAYNNRGVVYGEKDQHEQALTDFAKALDLNPYDAEVYSNRGVVYKYKGQHEQALADFTKALDLNPRLAQAYYNRGKTYTGQGQYEQALADFAKALDLNPHSALAYYNRGLAYNDKGHNEQALADFTKALKINPRNVDAYNNRGALYAMKGQHEQALADFTKVLELNPRDALAYHNRGLIYWEEGNKQKACADWKQACKLGECRAASAACK